MLPERDVNTLQRSLINSPEHQTQQPTRRPVTHGALLGAGGRKLHIAGTLRTDTWQGREDVQLHIDDVAPAD